MYSDVIKIITYISQDISWGHTRNTDHLLLSAILILPESLSNRKLVSMLRAILFLPRATSSRARLPINFRNLLFTLPRIELSELVFFPQYKQEASQWLQERLSISKIPGQLDNLHVRYEGKARES